MPTTAADRAHALTKSEFHAQLRNWLSGTAEPTVGDPKGKGGKLYVRDGGSLFHLNPDTGRSGVEAYLALVDLYGDDLLWTAVASESGRKTAVAYGPDVVRVSGFYLYVN
jgi:hypothetical protein